MTPKEKFKKLVNILYSKTYKKEIEWKNDDVLGTYCFVGSRMISLEEGHNEDMEPIETVEIRNSDGELAESFNDELFKDDTAPAGFTSYWNLMTLIRETARRQATGADDAIDAILLELDDDPPF